jgi:hypothetical protein
MFGWLVHDAVRTLSDIYCLYATQAPSHAALMWQLLTLFIDYQSCLNKSW